MDRSAALRAELVAAVETAPRRRPGRVAVAAVAAFAIAGAVTGGVSVAAVSQSDADVKVATAIALSVARANSVLLAGPFHLAATGDGEVLVPAAPEGANGLAIAFACESAGTFDQSIDGDWIASSTCDQASGVGGWVERPNALQHTITIDAAPDSSYQLWVAWVQEPPMPEMSTQQAAEIADGIATREEYVAAFNRFLGCMSAGGYDLGAIPQEGVTVFDFGIPTLAVEDGTDERCYVSQYQQVDMLWQIQNQDTSESTQVLRDCLTANGIPPAEKTEDVVQQLRDAGIDPADCMP